MQVRNHFPFPLAEFLCKVYLPVNFFKYNETDFFHYEYLDEFDTHVFVPPGSGSISQRYGSCSESGCGSGSFYHSAKIVRKTMISSVFCLLFAFFSSKNDVNVPSRSKIQKTCFKKIIFC
jgi:hypothetical protein